uniref:Putative secreted protein n=1 Tax=Anopheles triannulatus TaxID=58253 RepID=A0A2M4B275_9DIPT
MNFSSQIRRMKAVAALVMPLLACRPQCHFKKQKHIAQTKNIHPTTTTGDHRSTGHCTRGSVISARSPRKPSPGAADSVCSLQVHLVRRYAQRAARTKANGTDVCVRTSGWAPGWPSFRFLRCARRPRCPVVRWPARVLSRFAFPGSLRVMVMVGRCC